MIVGGMRDMAEAKRALIAELIDRGYSDDEIKSILGGNMLRVYQDVLDGA